MAASSGAQIRLIMSEYVKKKITCLVIVFLKKNTCYYYDYYFWRKYFEVEIF